jgi:hypothetical protein
VMIRLESLTLLCKRLLGEETMSMQCSIPPKFVGGGVAVE